MKCSFPSSVNSTDKNRLNSKFSSSLPNTFISSLRQLFSILEKTNCGYVPFDVFKRHFDCSTSTSDFLNELEIESKSNNYFITFPLLLTVIERSISASKHHPTIQIPKATRSSISLPLDRLPSTPKIERQIPIVYQTSNQLKRSSYNISNPVYYLNKSHENNDIDFSMIRSLKRYELERNLLIQTCDTLDRVKLYLTDRLSDMKIKQKSYCRYLKTAEVTGMAPASIYNRDLVADLFKLASTVIEDVNYDSKKLSDGKESKAKDDHIKQLETEKRILLKELIEMKHRKTRTIPVEIA